VYPRPVLCATSEAQTYRKAALVEFHLHSVKIYCITTDATARIFEKSLSLSRVGHSIRLVFDSDASFIPREGNDSTLNLISATWSASGWSWHRWKIRMCASHPDLLLTATQGPINGRCSAWRAMQTRKVRKLS